MEQRWQTTASLTYSLMYEQEATIQQFAAGKCQKMDILLQCYNLNVTAEANVHLRQKLNR